MTSNSSSSAAVRFVIVGFDGLRPDSVEADMPALSRFMASNHSWSHYLADFPTETYVNHPGIFSGFRPTGHGLVANCYWRRDMGGADGVFFGFDLEHVLRHRREDGLLLVPTMGERLGAAGKTMTVQLPEDAGFWVYDANGQVTASSVLGDTGAVTLPEGGLVVFAGDPGARFHLRFTA